jgi:hypothetical protein
MFILRWIFYILVAFGLFLGGAYLYAPYNDGPVAIFPGGAFQSDEGTATSWAFASAYPTLELELRPEAPYSVALGFVMRDDKIYIDPLEGRQWFEYLKANQDVRVRFEDTVYKATAVLVEDEAEKEGMDPARVIYRLELRE